MQDEPKEEMLQPGGEPVPLPKPEWMEMSTEHINALLAERGIPKDEVRPAALPEYNGSSDEHVLAGGVTAAEAFTLFKAHYDTEEARAIGIEVSRISPAQVAGKKVWLPDLTGRDAARKHFQHEAWRKERELQSVKGQLEIAKGDLALVIKRYAQTRTALQMVLFDQLEGRDAPTRKLFRKEVLDHPDGKIEQADIDDLLTKAAEIDDLLTKTAELIATWVKAHDEPAAPRKKASRPARPKARKKKPASLRSKVKRAR